MRRTAVLALSALAVGAGGAASTAKAAEAPVTLGVCQAAKSEPKIITLAVDGSGFLGGYAGHGHLSYATAHPGSLRWTHWSASEGIATGYEWIDDGYPSVGGGTYYAVPATIKVDDPVGGVFRSMTITTTPRADFKPNKYWKNPAHTRTLKAENCGHGTWSW